MTVEAAVNEFPEDGSSKKKKLSSTSKFLHSDKLIISLIVSVIVMFFVMIVGISVVMTKVELLSMEKDLVRMDLRELRSKMFSINDGSDDGMKYLPNEYDAPTNDDVRSSVVNQIQLEGDNSVSAATTSRGNIRHWQPVHPFSTSNFRFNQRDGSIRVLKGGYYLIYAQLYFQAGANINTLSFDVQVDGDTFLYCKNSHPLSTCSVTGVKKLEANQEVAVISTFPKINLKFRGRSSSFGMVRL